MEREVSRTGIARLRSREAERSAPSPKTNQQGQTDSRRTARRPLRKSHLSPERQWLVETMQQLGFGKIKRLIVVNRQPLRSPPPKLLRHRRLTGPNARRPEAGLDDFILKEQVVKLFEEFDHIGDGVIASLDVRDGLPYGMALEEPVRA